MLFVARRAFQESVPFSKVKSVKRLMQTNHSSEISKRLALAKICAEEAGEIISKSMRERDISGSQISFQTKSSIVDPVTEVDAECERLIVSKIHDVFPSDLILAEENHNSEPLTDAWTWIIDPIDGTRNFLHRLPNVSVSIGIAHNQQSVAGVVHAPIFNETYSASIGNGAYLNHRRIQVSKIQDVRQAAVSTDINSREPGLLRRTMSQWENLLLANVQNLRNRGSAALEMCSIACGRLDGHFEDSLDLWDVAAATLIVEEAGGICWARNARPFDLATFDGFVFAASSTTLAKQIVTISKL